MASLEGKFQQLIDALQPGQFTARQPVVTPVSMPQMLRRARLAWPRDIVLEDAQIREVAGDGDCLWHTMYACTQPGVVPGPVAKGPRNLSRTFAKESSIATQCMQVLGDVIPIASQAS